MNISRLVVSTPALALAALLAACGGGGGDDDTPAAAAVPARAGSAVIGSAGGTVDAVLEGGATVQLDVPAGALAADTTVRIDPQGAPAGQLGSFKLSAGNTTLQALVRLTVTLPAGPAPDADTILMMNSGSRRVPLSAEVDPATRTMTVDLPMLGSAVPATARKATDGFRQQATNPSLDELTILLGRFSLEQRIILLDVVTSDLASDGSFANAANVQLAMSSVLGIAKADADSRVRTDLFTWRQVVCGQQAFASSALNSFNGVAIPTFTQLAADVLQWDRFAQDLGGLVARVSSPAEPGCANVPADFVQPVRDRLPAFLSRVTADLDLLDPNVFSPPAPSQVVGDFDVLFRNRSKELFALADKLASVGAVDLQNLTVRVVTGQLDRSRNIAYSTCRSGLDQKLQAKLLEIVLTDPLLASAASAGAAPFGQADLWTDIQFCGMPLHWKVVDANGAVIQQGDAGGIGPGFTTTSAALNLAGAAKIVLSGPLAALICPVASQNNEQLVFNSGPLVGAATSVQSITPSGTNQYLQSSSQDFDVATLLSQGAAKLVVARQGAICSGEFPGLTAHDAIATFALTSSIPVQITASSLPAATAGSSYSAGISVGGGAAPFTWTAGGLPAGLSIDPQTGTLSGSVANPGAFAIALGVSSADGTSAQTTLTLNVVANVAGTYIGTATDHTTNFVSQGVTRAVTQSGNLIRISDTAVVCELAPGGTLNFLGLTRGGFVVDPTLRVFFTFSGRIVGNALTFRITDLPSPGNPTPDDDSFDLVKQ